MTTRRERIVQIPLMTEKLHPMGSWVTVRLKGSNRTSMPEVTDWVLYTDEFEIVCPALLAAPPIPYRRFLLQMWRLIFGRLLRRWTLQAAGDRIQAIELECERILAFWGPPRAGLLGTGFPYE